MIACTRCSSISWRAARDHLVGGLPAGVDKTGRSRRPRMPPGSVDLLDRQRDAVAELDPSAADGPVSGSMLPIGIDSSITLDHRIRRTVAAGRSGSGS